MIYRKTKIKRCVQDLVESARDNPGWLESIFLDGFKGFRQMTEVELDQAYRDAGLPERYGDPDHYDNYPDYPEVEE